MDSLGAAVHYALDTVSLGSFQNVPRTSHFDIPVDSIRLQDVSEGRCKVINDVAPIDTAVDNVRITHGAGDQLGAELPELCIEQAGILVEGSDLVAVCEQPADQM
jgi:hypothetical protein